MLNWVWLWSRRLGPEYVLREVRENIMLSFEQDLNRCKHPIMHEELQSCNMPKDKLSLLRMATLKDICKEYGIDVSGRRCFPCWLLYLYVVQLNFVKKIQVNLIQEIHASWNLREFPEFATLVALFSIKVNFQGT